MLLISYLMKCSDFVCFYFSLQVVVLKMYNVKKSVQMDFKNKYLKYIILVQMFQSILRIINVGSTY